MYFLSEVSSNHHGSLERCIEFIHKSHSIGCDGVKFQMFKVEELFSPEAIKARPEFLKRKAWELPKEFIEPISNECKKLGIDFGCTPFFLDAVDMLVDYVDFFKIASYELMWTDLLISVAKTKKPIIISCGMANYKEIDKSIETLLANGAENIKLLHCVSGYPTPLEDCNLKVIDTLSKRFDKIDIGWSDHTVNPFVLSHAIQKWGAKIIEFHLDLDGEGDEFKTGHCWLPDDIEKVISGIKNSQIIDGDGYKRPAKSELFDRDWRADPSDGLRPLIAIRDDL
jgi:N-acetylneuraminate synthase